MAQSVFQRLHRLEEIKRREAMQAVAIALADEADQAEAVRALTARQEEAHTLSRTQPALRAYLGGLALHTELERRSAHAAHVTSTERTEHARADLDRTARDARTVERLAEIVDLEEAAAEARADAIALDALGAERWRRRAS